MTMLSNRAINLLKSDNTTWYKGYVLGERESEFQTYFALGKAFANSVESYHKTGDWQQEKYSNEMKKEFELAGKMEDYDKYLVQLHEVIENAKLVVTVRCDKSEFQNIVPIDDKYSLKSKYDALRDDYVEDYKTVSSFTNADEAKPKYEQQMMIYQYSEFKRTGKKIKGLITEIKKGKATLPTKKDDLIAMIPEGVDTSGGVKELKARLYLHTTAEQVSQKIWFEWSDDIITKTESLLQKAIKKAERLKTLDLEDIL